jgi:uncharacterized protein YdaU (DUF1376 family)
VNYYKRHIGDIARDLSNLSQGAMGAYDLLMDWYYANEKPLPLDPDDIYNITRARTKDERKNAAKARGFFDADGRHSRCDEEIAKYRAQAEVNRTTAEAREQKKRATKQAQDEHESCTNGSPSAHCEPSHKPLKEQEQKTPPNPLTGEPAAAAIIAEYHAALPRCQRIEVLNPKRRKRIAVIDKLAASLCQQQGWTYDRATFWRAYFAECASDPWLRGEQPNPKNPAWKQNLDVLIREDRFAGIMDSAISAMKVAA